MAGAYAQTPEWKKIRKEVIEEAGGRCRLCNSDEKLQVHHRIYNEDCAAGIESKQDLTVLCGRCHLTFHRAQWRGAVGGETKAKYKRKRPTKQEQLEEIQAELAAVRPPPTVTYAVGACPF